jgi:alanine racemase
MLAQDKNAYYRAVSFLPPIAPVPMRSPRLTPTLEVNLPALVRNYAHLASRLHSGRAAAVVKANAYGLGIGRVAPALYNDGCRDFFVATLDEGIALRGLLPFSGEQAATIYVFHGARSGQAKDFLAHRLLPVLNSLEQIAAWNDAGACALHIDTGMCRLGLTPEEAEALPQYACKPQLVLSHLACANDPADTKNHRQLETFRRLRARFPEAQASFANSSGIFLSPDYHFDLVRPGCSLYGIAPNTLRINPMEHVATLSAPVLQYRAIDHDQTVGYSATATVTAGSVLATVELGYADGLLRSLSNRGYGYVGATRLPIVGRVSMDMVSVDVTPLPAHLRSPDLRINFICENQPVDAVAESAGTIGYEILTGMGPRVERVYS